MKFKLYLFLFIFLPIFSVAQNINLKIIETETKNFKSIYDELLPSFIRIVFTDSKSTIEKQISKQNDFLWTWNGENSFNSYGNYHGLGSQTISWNTSTMLAFDKLYCSEIDMLVAISYRMQHEISRLDVTKHTLYEVKDNNGRWIAVDPMFNPKILNNKGQLASFEELQHPAKYKLKSLRMNSKELESYLNLFSKEKYTPPPKEEFDNNKYLRKTTFGERRIYPKIFKGKINTHSLKETMTMLKKNGINKSSKAYSDLILINYYLPFLHKIYSENNKENARTNIWAIQDILLSKIKPNLYGIYWSEEYYKIWEARQYQVLGRFKKAENIFKELLKNNTIYKKQIIEYIAIGNKLKKYL